MTIMSQMMSPGSLRRKPLDRAQRRAWRTHQKLLDASLEMFNQKGIDATSIQDITERADVGKGTFYRHFADKDEVKQELVAKAVDNLVGRLGNQTSQWASLPEAVEGLLRAHLEFFRDCPGQFAMLFQDRMLMGPHQPKPDELAGPYLKYLSQVQDRLAGLAGKAADPVRIRLFTHAIAGFISGNYSFAMVGLSEEDVRTQLEPFRRGFVAAAANYLSDDGTGTATAASPIGATNN